MTRNQRGQFTREEHISTKPMVQLIIIDGHGISISPDRGVLGS
jgi:hypothetical protein